MTIAPIILFVYNRLAHTKRTVETLQQNLLASESDLIVYSDGPKKNDDEEKITAIRDYLRTVKDFKSVKVVPREKNFGLARSITDGVTEVLKTHEAAIILEDDLITSKYFLKYMNDALNLYQNDDRVICITGYAYPVKTELPVTFFLKSADCWGWATWQRGWKLFNPNGEELLELLRVKGLQQRFDFNGPGFYSKLLTDQINKKINSWAILWYASALINDKFTLYPGKSLVQNIGMDASGTHGSATEHFATTVSNRPVMVGSARVEEDPQIIREYRDFLYSRSSVKQKMIDSIKNFLKK